MAESRSIDDLPEGLLLHILSFLPTIDAVSASLLSRKWRNLWHHIPTLNFDMRSNSRDFFADFITQTLFLRPHTTPIHSFRLLFSYRNYLRTQIQVDSWVRHAIAFGAADLRLSFDDDLFIFGNIGIGIGIGRRIDAESDTDSDDSYTYQKYEFHFSDLKNSCCSVRVLELVNCDIIWPNTVPTDAAFSSLTSVSLHDVSLADEELFALVSSCVNLEFLHLSNLDRLHDFKIHSQTLKELKLGYFKFQLSLDDEGYLEICAPNLNTITFHCFSMAEYCSKDLSSLVEARVNFLDRSEDDFDCWCDIMILLSGIERLTVQNMRLNRDVWLEVFDTKDISESPPFKNLKYLELQTGFAEYDLVGIAAFLELCPDLETLVLDYFYKTDDSLSEEFKSNPLTFHIPCLKKVKMKSYNGSDKELYFVELLKMHKVVLQKIVAFPQKVDEKLLHSVVLLDDINHISTKHRQSQERGSSSTSSPPFQRSTPFELPYSPENGISSPKPSSSVPYPLFPPPLQLPHPNPSRLRHAIASGATVISLSCNDDIFVFRIPEAAAESDTGGDSDDDDDDSDTYYNLTGEEFFAMVSSCINLEFLSLSNLDRFRNFKIHSNTLKELELGYFNIDLFRTDKGYLEIHAPNLHTINFDARRIYRLWLKLTGIEQLNVQNMRLNPDVWLEVFDTKDISESPPFKNLKYLELQTGCAEYDLVGIGAFLELCPDLETLVVDYFYKTDDSLSEDFKSNPPILHVPRLKQLKMKSYNGTEKELYFVELLKMHKSRHDKQRVAGLE
ncbi:hypothetical protein BUALT_Bualt03G0203600 [Buddleja alternifolia]|uniref:F-box domain-containing protein n=1 Tax=Buddleja alternifolia TaxID=168488 RepID=A0AAV6XVC8_9LAMI|nr:hypothetical protein BUALT_Bualt03G0203600 [Buddleja alternifolia]